MHMTGLVSLIALASVASAATTLPLRAATYNVAVLSARDSDARFADIAGTVKRSGFPELLALQEIADDDGLSDSGDVSAHASLRKLQEALTRAGGPIYKALYVDPENNNDGGPPGANIRCVLLINVQARATAGPLFLNDPAFADTRKPLHVHVDLADGALDVVVVHLSATPSATAKRATQAQRLADWVRQHAERDLIVMGDFNAIDGEAVWPTLSRAGLIDTSVQGEPTHQSGHAFDRILISDGLQVSHPPAVMPRTAGSDHALVWAPLRPRGEVQNAGCTYTPKPTPSLGFLLLFAYAQRIASRNWRRRLPA